MNEIKIPLDGKETVITVNEIDLNNLKLDELNPRISFFRDNQVTEYLTDDQMIFALTNKKSEAFRKLKDSIHNNKGIINPIWVEPLVEGSFRIIEGNSRYVVYKRLHEEEPYEEKWKSIISYILPFEVSSEQKDFIRLQSHLRGTTEWDAYEKAKYLFTLWDKDGWSVGRLEMQTKMTENQIYENIEAYRIMENQYLPSHGDDPNEVSKFSYFVEYVKDKKLQKFMEKDNKTVEDFCNWVADKFMIPTGQDVRKLRDIFESDDTKNAFINKGFESAMQILELKKPYLVSTLYRDIENVIDRLKEISAQELDEIIYEEDSEKERMIHDLAKWSNKVAKLIATEKEKNGFRTT